MTDKRILFDRFEFPRIKGLEYLLNEGSAVTDYLFVNEPHDEFSMYFEKDFPVFTVPENSEEPYCVFEMKRPGRKIKFFCPEKHAHLDTVVWYFHVELLDDLGMTHGLPGQVRVGMRDPGVYLSTGSPKFLEVLEQVRLARISPA